VLPRKAPWIVNAGEADAADVLRAAVEARSRFTP
jgi:hypothetical protein